MSIPRDAWGPCYLQGQALRNAGVAALDLYLNPQAWVSRRVERISFVDDRYAHHQIGVDFRFEATVPPAAMYDQEPTYCAPIFLLAKDFDDGHFRPPTVPPRTPYANIDLIDSTGRRLSLPTRSSAKELAASMLCAYAERVLGQPASDPVQVTLATIALSDSRKASPALSVLLTSDTDQYPSLRNSPEFKEVATAFAGFAPVILWKAGEPPGHSIVKLSYNEPTVRTEVPWHVKARRSLGWKSFLHFVYLSEVGAAESYHVEVTLPPELQATEAGLLGEHYRFGWDGLPEEQPQGADAAKRKKSRDENRYYVKEPGHASGAHLYVPNARTRAVGAAWIKVRVRRQGFLVGALVASIVTATILALYAIGADQIAKTDTSEGAIAALLLVPTLLSAYVARPGEHAMTARMLRWARIALVTNGALPFWAAYRLVTLAADDKHPDRTLAHTWWPLTYAACAYVVLFGLSNIFPHSHGWAKYKVPS